MEPFSWIAILIAVGTGVAGNMIWAGLRATWSFLPIRSDPVRKSVAGEWQGVFKQASLDGKVENFDLTLKLKVGRKTVTGTGTYMSDGAKTNVDIRGGFVEARGLILTYKNSDPAKLQHGEVILMLSNDAAVLEGAFVGLGVVTNRVGSGSVRLTKKQ